MEARLTHGWTPSTGVSLLFQKLLDAGLIPESELPIPSAAFLAQLLEIERELYETWVIDGD